MATDFEQKVYGGEYRTKLPYGPTHVERNAHREDEDRLTAQFREDARAYAIEQGVPEQYVSKVVSRAWEDGHAHGFEEILNCMYGLIEIFNADPTSSGTPSGWRQLAYWLADVQAATAYDYTKKSASKSDRRRHTNICQDLLLMLKVGDLIGKRPSQPEDVVKRLEKAIRDLKAAL